MDQHWNIVSFDKEESMTCDNLSHILFCDQKQVIYRLLTTSTLYNQVRLGEDILRQWIVLSTSTAELRERDAKQALSLPGQETVPKATLLSLPIEAIREIFRNLHETLDAICFGLVSQFLWRVGERSIVYLLERERAPWVGTRLMCVGEYIKSRDFPPGFELSPAENEKLCQIRARMPRKVPTLFLLSSIFATPTMTEYVPAPSTRYRTRHQSILKLDWYLQCWSHTTFMALQPWRFTENGGLVLRNLTKRIYVRESATPVHLGAVLVAHICWTSVAENDHEAMVNRGPWTGDRFDIKVMAEHQMDLERLDEKDRDAWTDVSEGIATRMETLWRHFFGDEWKENALRAKDEHTVWNHYAEEAIW